MTNTESPKKTKRYVWFKLQQDFFQKLPVRKMERQEDWVVLVNTYLKLLLLSVSGEGVIPFQGVFDNLAEEISETARIDSDVVNSTIQYLTENNLAEIREDGSLVLYEALENIGSETESAERMRKFRERHRGTGEASHCDERVTDSDEMVTTETEEETEEDAEEETDKDGDEDEDEEAESDREAKPIRGSESVDSVLKGSGSNVCSVYAVLRVCEREGIPESFGEMFFHKFDPERSKKKWSDVLRAWWDRELDKKKYLEMPLSRVKFVPELAELWKAGRISTDNACLFLNNRLLRDEIEKRFSDSALVMDLLGAVRQKHEENFENQYGEPWQEDEPLPFD